MKTFKSLCTVFLPYTILIVLFAMERALQIASQTYVYPNMNLYYILIGLILGVSLYLVSTVEIKTSTEKIVFIVSTVIWIILLLFVWMKMYIALSVFIVAMMNKLYLLIAITVVHVLKVINILMKRKEKTSGTWIS